jgi:DNA polymerase
MAATWATLDEVRAEAMGCTKCRLAGGRTQVVWMDGNPESDLMFIGEGPGYHEDKQGLPFVGAAGQLLDKMMASVGLDRTQCTVCNIVKCRPPGNRDPLPDEIESCRPYLEAQIQFIRPRVIVTLGNFATRFILDKPASISKVRGQRFQAFGATVIPTFHPAAVLRGGGMASKAMESLREDFQLIQKALHEPLQVQAEQVEQQAFF